MAISVHTIISNDPQTAGLDAAGEVHTWVSGNVTTLHGIAIAQLGNGKIMTMIAYE